MASERKSTMVSARVPSAVVSRLDFVVRNTEGHDTRNRSAALLTALESWLPGIEQELERRGLLPKKAR